MVGLATPLTWPPTNAATLSFPSDEIVPLISRVAVTVIEFAKSLGFTDHEGACAVAKLEKEESAKMSIVRKKFL
jgi:hypothetical protein